MPGEAEVRGDEMKRTPVEGLSLAVQEVIGMLDTAISLGVEHTADSESREADTTEPKERKVAKEKTLLEEKLLTGRKQVYIIIAPTASCLSP